MNDLIEQKRKEVAALMDKIADGDAMAENMEKVTKLEAAIFQLRRERMSLG